MTFLCSFSRFFNLSFTVLIVCLLQGLLIEGNPDWDFTKHPKKDTPWLIIQEAQARMLFEEPMFRYLVHCMADNAAIESNPCISSLVLNQNSTSVDAFYTNVKTKSIAMCEQRCDQSYRESMTRIADKCVIEVTERMRTSPSLGSDINTLSRVIRELGSSLVGLFKERACIRHTTNPQTLCMVDVIDFTMQNKYLNIAPVLFRKSVFSSFGGMKSMFNHLDPLQMDTLGPKHFCTPCHLQFLRNVETYFASKFHPLFLSMSSETISRAMIQYNKFIQQTNQLCGANSLVPKLSNPSSSLSSAAGTQADIAILGRIALSSSPPSIPSNVMYKLLFLCLFLVFTLW